MYRPLPDITDLDDSSIRAVAFDNGRSDFKNNVGQRKDPDRTQHASLSQVRLYRDYYEQGWAHAVHRWREQNKSAHRRAG